MNTSKLLISFIIPMVLLFFSCSKDNGDINVPNGGSKTAKYPVTFNVSAFEAQISPLSEKSLEENIRTFLQYVVYTEDGSVYNDKDSGKLNKVIDIHGQDITKQKINLELPEGKYKIAFVRGRYLDPFIYGINCPVNFYSDFCAGNIDFNPGGRKPNNNYEIYYEWVDLTVVPSVNIEKSIELQPMWSNLSIKINDLSTCILPANTTKISLIIDNYTYGFYIENKKAKNEGYLGGSGFGAYKWPDVNIESFKKGESFKKLLIAENPQTYLALSFYDNADKFLGTIKLYEGKLSRGKNITISGKLGDLSKLNPADSTSQEFHLSLGPLVDEEINFID